MYNLGLISIQPKPTVLLTSSKHPPTKKISPSAASGVFRHQTGPPCSCSPGFVIQERPLPAHNNLELRNHGVFLPGGEGEGGGGEEETSVVTSRKSPILSLQRAKQINLRKAVQQVKCTQLYFQLL